MNTMYDPDKQHLRSIRLKGDDYRQPGAYFVTICAQDRQWMFGGYHGRRECMSPMRLSVEDDWKFHLTTNMCEILNFIVSRPAGGTHGRLVS
jgi:hypothetical protein